MIQHKFLAIFELLFLKEHFNLLFLGEDSQNLFVSGVFPMRESQDRKMEAERKSMGFFVTKRK